MHMKTNKFMKKRTLFAYLVLSLVVFSIANVLAVGELSANTALLKVSLKEGSFVSKQVGFSSSSGGNVFLEIVGAKGVSLPKSSFVLSSNENVNADIVFNSSNLAPGVYTGSMRIKSEFEERIISLVFEVESEDLFFDANLDIPPVYSKVSSGENVLVQVKIFDLNSGGTQTGMSPTPVEVNYVVYNNRGESVASESESLIVDKSASVSKSIPLPETLPVGEYVVATIVKYRNSIGVSSGIFSVVAVEKSSLFDFQGGSGLYVLLAFVVIVVLGMLFFFLLIRDRDKLILELKKYNDSELQEQKEFLKEQMSLLTKKGVSSQKEVKKEVSSKIDKLKKKHVQRVEILRKLKKDGQIEMMKKKMNAWKSKGYSNLLLESKLNGLNSSDMQKIMSGWRKKGYKL